MLSLPLVRGGSSLREQCALVHSEGKIFDFMRTAISTHASTQMQLFVPVHAAVSPLAALSAVANERMIASLARAGTHLCISAVIHTVTAAAATNRQQCTCTHTSRMQ